MTVNTAATMDLVKAALGAPNQALTNDVNKAYTQASGLVAYDLQGPALSLFPVLTPLRNSIPRVGANGGTATNWKAVTAVNPSRFSAGVSEGNRGAVIDQSTADYTAAFRTIGLENWVSFEADEAARGFDDVKAKAALNLLQATMIAEESLDYAGNTSLALGTTPTPTLVASNSGGSIATGTASVVCIALAHAGARRSSLAAGVVGQITKTNADGTTDTFGGGSAQKSANATVGVTGPSASVAASVTPVFGAFAYAWYIGAAGSERLAAITTINSVVLTSYPGASQLASAIPAADNSRNTLVYDGLCTMAQSSGSGAYRVTLPTGTAGVGTPLTSDGKGGIVQVNDAFTWFWDNYRISPDALWVAAQELQNITTKVVANGGVPLIRATTSAETQMGISSGFVVDQILNPITQTYVKVRVHPDAIAGTMLFTTSAIPYPLAGIGNVVQKKCRRDYYQIEWPPARRRYEYGVYMDGVLQHYAPFSLGVIQNVANG